MLDIVMCDAIYFLTYTSKITLLGAINPFTFKTIEQISRQNNHAQHITGFLLFKNGHFFQYLEGDKALVTHLYQDLLKETFARTDTQKLVKMI
ncbi:BLUF domain-containing protein [Moraxella osloensis]|nr:BLUF domain-containing protein [Moraxella osloensis]